MFNAIQHRLTQLEQEFKYAAGCYERVTTEALSDKINDHEFVCQLGEHMIIRMMKVLSEELQRRNPMV